MSCWVLWKQSVRQSLECEMFSRDRTLLEEAERKAEHDSGPTEPQAPAENSAAGAPQWPCDSGPDGALYAPVSSFPRGAVASGSNRIYSLSSGGHKSDSKASAGLCPPPQRSGGAPFLTSFSFWRRQVFPDLWLHHASLCLCLRGASPLCLNLKSPSAFFL